MNEPQSNKLLLILAKLNEISQKLDNKGDSEIPQYLSIKTVAAMLDMEENAVRQMIHRREIPSYKLGRRRLVRLDDLTMVMVEYRTMDDILNN